MSLHLGSPLMRDVALHVGVETSNDGYTSALLIPTLPQGLKQLTEAPTARPLLRTWTRSAAMPLSLVPGDVLTLCMMFVGKNKGQKTCIRHGQN